MTLRIATSRGRHGSTGVEGELSGAAPTVLELLGLPAPPQMTGSSLLADTPHT